MSRVRPVAPFAALAVAVLALLVACTRAPERPAPSFDRPPPRTPDGLERVESGVFELVYVKPGLDLSSYDKIRIRPIGLGYKAEPRQGLLARQTENFELTAEQRSAVSRALAGAFSRAMTQDGRYTLVTSRLEGAMQIKLALAQLEVNIPPGTADQNEPIVVEKIGELTLVVDISDAATGEPLVRGRDSYVVENVPGGETRETVRLELAQLFERWSRQIRAGLDQLSPRSGG